MAKVTFDKRGLIIGEPKWSKNMTDEKVESLMRICLNFYANNATKNALKDDLFKILTEIDHGISKKNIKRLKYHFDFISFTAYKLCRMMNLGMPKSEKHLTFVHDQVKDALNRLPPEPKKEDQKPVISPLQRLQEKVESTSIADLEDMIDVWLEDITVKGEPISIVESVQRNEIPPKGFSFIYDWLNKYKAEFSGALLGEDEYLVESYSHVDSMVLKSWDKSIDKLIEALEFIEQKKKRAKHRKAAAKPKNRIQELKILRKKVASISYLEEEPKFGLKSVDPQDIIGVRDIYAYNVKYGQFIHWTALGREGLDVKGTTLQNFDPKLSYRIRLRKPEEFFKIVNDPQITANKIEKTVKALTTKVGGTNGRLNNNTIILKTYK